MSFAQKVVYIDVPEKSLKDGTAVLPHQQDTLHQLHLWQDICEEVPPKDMMRVIYHMKADAPDPAVPNAENCWTVVLSPHRGEDIAASFRDVDRMLSTFANNGKPVIPPGYKPTLEPPGKTYVHCSNDVFGKHLFHPVSNHRHDKPDGGFWASAIDAPHKWEDWASVELGEDYHVEKQVQFTVAPGARIFQIASVDDLAYLAATYPSRDDASLEELGLGECCIDWQAMAMEWDGMSYDYGALRNDMAYMDCDCIAIFNPDIIQCVNPEQDISQPRPEAPEFTKMYAIEYFDVREIAQPGWADRLPSKTATNWHLYTTAEPYGAVKMSTRDLGAPRSEWGKLEGARMHDAAVMYEVNIPQDMMQRMMDRVDMDHTYVTTAEITPEMILGPAKVMIWDTPFTYHRELTVEEAPARAAEVVSLVNAALPLWSTLNPAQQSSALYSSQSFEMMYGSQGLVTRGYQPEDPHWQKPLCEMAQQVHDSKLPLMDKIDIAGMLDKVLVRIEETPTEAFAINQYGKLIQRMADIANDVYETNFGMQVQQWLEHFLEHPEDFVPNNEDITLD